MNEFSTTSAWPVFWQAMSDLTGEWAHAMWLDEIEPHPGDEDYIEEKRRAAWSRVADGVDELGRELRRELPVAG